MADTARTWFVVDDQLQEVQSFCASFQAESEGRPYAWIGLKPAKAVVKLLEPSKLAIAGVLLDIDLSADPKVTGTGLGLAQDLRAKQKNNDIADYPLVRFANPGPVERYVGSDPVSGDLFDLLIGKEYATSSPKAVVEECLAIRGIYDRLEARKFTLQEFAGLCGLTPDKFELWGDARFYQRVSTGLAAALHVGAGTFIRSFLVPDGLLVGEELLAVRCGVDRGASGKSWAALKSALDPALYTGLGAAGFKRWWARGLEAFWFSVDPETYLHELAVSERVSRLSECQGLAGLVPLQLSEESPGDRYWRLCALSTEKGRTLPVDPQYGVALTSTVQRDPWLEPEQAAQGVAATERADPRLAGTVK